MKLNSEELKGLLRTYLAPILSATVQENIIASTPRQQCIASLDPNRIAVKAQREDLNRVVIHRRQQFSSVDREIIKCFVEELLEMYSATTEAYRHALIRNLPIRAISRYLGNYRAPEVILEQFETWAAMTYEGGSITTSIGVDLRAAESNVQLEEIFPMDFSAVISNGYDTLLVANEEAEIIGSGQLSGGQLEITNSPFRLNLISEWCTNGRIAFVLNRLGEQLVFRNQELLFAKRRGEWQIYAHETYITRLHPFARNRALRDAIYASCLDISYARTGGCIIIMSDPTRVNELACTEDRIDIEPTNPKSRTIRSMIQDVFHRLDRRLRQELLALDGAMVLDHHGNILAVGAIISVPAGSEGGGRRAAAMKGSEYGMGIKISEDGEITAFEERELIFKT